MGVDSVMMREVVEVRPGFESFPDLAAAARWYDRWARVEALPLWWEQGADMARGGFHEALSVEGEPRPGARRARVQSRQTYAYATAGALGWDGPWLEAARHGIDFFVGKFRREDGLFRTLVGLDGSVLDDTPMLYDQAFALLATATLHRVDRDRIDLRAVALGVLRGLDGMRAPAGGFRENIAHPYQANAHMHLLEGALAWAENDGGVWEAMADEIVEMTLRLFIDPARGFLNEFFDENWKLVAGEEGRLIEPGHQFEWAWLLERWARRRGREDVTAVARRLYEAGLRGIDRQRGVTINELWDDFSVRSATARFWPQTERLKAELTFGSQADQVQAAEALTLYLDTPARGAWYDKLRPDGTFVDEPAPATSFYHILCACTELFRAAGR